MSNKRPPDFTKDEVILITATLRERYGHDIEVEQAYAEIRLSPAIPKITECLIVYWELDKCHFLIARADKHHFICHFYYRLYQTYGTEKNATTICSIASSAFLNRRSIMRRTNVNKIQSNKI